METSDLKIWFIGLTNKSWQRHASLINSNLTRNPMTPTASPRQAETCVTASLETNLKTPLLLNPSSTNSVDHQMIIGNSRNYSGYLIPQRRSEWGPKPERKASRLADGPSWSTMFLSKVTPCLLSGLSLFGKNWKKVERLIPTRTSMQIWSHA